MEQKLSVASVESGAAMEPPGHVGTAEFAVRAGIELHEVGKYYKTF